MDKQYPLTKQQQGLWIEQLLHPSNSSYNTCVQLRLTGPLEIIRFEMATRDAINFFDTLKVYFGSDAQGPYQRLKRNAQFDLRVKDISGGNQEETAAQEQQAKAILAEQLATPVDLTQFPIMRGLLVKTAHETFYFIGMVPHIVSDGRSAVLYLESLSIAYNRGAEGLVKAYGESRKTWEDYFAEGLAKIDSGWHQEAKEYWQKRLANANHFFDYSYGKVAPNNEDKRGRRKYFDLSAKMSLALKQHAKKNRTTLFNVFVCAFGIFVNRYFRIDDLLIGYPVNIRPRGYQHFFGFFVNILPLRVMMGDNPSYQQLLGEVTLGRKQDKKYQAFPALDIVAAVREMRQDFDGRLFNLSMAQTVSRLFNLQLDGIESEPLDTEYFDVNDDFSLSYELIEERIGLWFEYRQALFSDAFVAQAMQHIEMILQQILETPERRVTEFSLLSLTARNLVLSQAKGPELALDPSRNVCKLFEQICVRYPAEKALLSAHRSMTYTELNQRANRLANQLRCEGVQPGNIVALCLSHGQARIVAMLAVLKTGAAYLPIPADFPPRRTAPILRQAKAEFILFEAEALALGEIEVKAQPLLMGPIIERSKAQPNSDLDVNIGPEAMAYLIFTSGSTGTPKGVMVSHASLASRLQALQAQVRISSQERMLQSTDYSFDVSVAEIFWPLTQGAALVVEDFTEAQSKRTNPARLLDIMQRHRVTLSCMVPSLLRSLLLLEPAQKWSSLKTMLAAGEPLDASLAEDFLRQSQSGLFNVYGPTEATIYATCQQVTLAGLGSLNIGRPIGDTHCYILNPQGELLPQGVVGELVIGGPGIAEGYVGEPQLSAEVFVCKPFASGRVYLTGDLARWTFEGEIELFGRKDHQVKIRGYRIELGDIENALLASPSVTDAAVIAEGGETAKSLLALVATAGGEFASHRLKAELAERLPGYMLPAQIIRLDAIPRLPSGKLDRLALARCRTRLRSEAAKVPPQTSTQKKIADLWAQILPLDRDSISIETSFFDLGGDSLMAIQFVSLAQQQQLYFATADLFECRTIARLAKVAKTEEPATIETPRDPINAAAPYPLLARQAKFFADNFSNPHHWNRNFSFELSAPLDPTRFRRALGALLKRHENLAVDFSQDEEGQWWQQRRAHIDLDDIFRVYALTECDAGARARRIVELTNQQNQRINLHRAPLLRALLFESDQDQGRLVLILHHLLVDMVSSRIIFEDLVHLYLSDSKASLLSPRTASVSEFARHLQAPLKPARREAAWKYWGNLPRQAKPEMSKFLAQKNQEADALIRAFDFDPELTRQLLTRLPQDTDIPIQDLLVAATFYALNQWSGQSELVYATCGHGRDGEEGFELGRTVGWLNTVYPVYLRGALAGDANAEQTRQFVQSVKRQIDAVPKHNGDYNRLRYLLADEAFRQMVSPQVFFNYVGQLDAIIPPGVPFRPIQDLPGSAGIAPQNHLCYWLYFEVGVVAGRVTFRLTYSQRLFAENTVSRMVEQIGEQAKRMVESLLRVTPA